MEQAVFYCKTWFRARKIPTQVWTKEQAKLAHVKNQHYAVLVGSIDRPYCFLDVAHKVVGVGFLDEHLRETLTYSFQEVESGGLFLTIAIHREFEGETDKVVGGTSYRFKEDGTVQITRESFNTHHVETASTTSDVSINYSAAPEFGEYDDLIMIDRGSK